MIFLSLILLIIGIFASSFFLSKYFSSHPIPWIPLDHPNGRSLHASPTPRTGGIAIFVSLSLGLILLSVLRKLGFFPFFYKEILSKEPLWIIGMSLLIGAISFWDDRKSVSPGIRFGIHFIASLGIVWGANLVIDHLTIPYLGSFSLGLLSPLITVLFILWMTNLFNFMDGMDGFAGGMTFFGFSFLSYFLWKEGSHSLAFISILITSATGGFLFHNLPPAKIFMGDVGSVPLGFLSAILIIIGIKKEIFDIELPIIIFSPFIVDATVTLLRRILKGKNVWMPHREHYYQRLVLAGWGHTKTVIAEYVLMITAGLSMLLYTNMNEIWKLTILFSWLLIYASFMLAVGVLERGSLMKTRSTLLTGLLIADLILISTSFWLTSLCFHLDPQKLWTFCLIIIGIKISLFAYMGLYRAILRFAGLPLASTIIKATALSSILFFLFITRSPQKFPIGFVFMDYLITTFLIGLLRFLPRYFSESWRENGSRRILIYGAGDLGEEVARKLLRNSEDYRLIGFIDDKSSKIGKRLHNLPICGPIDDLSQILTHHKISELIIAISSLEGDAIRNITRQCRANGVLCRIVPTFSNMLKKEIDIKNIDISDLLRREPKDLDEPQIKRFIKDKIIMITGAGGSIGSELARQCIQYGARRLILIDQSELNLYTLKEELASSKTPIIFCLLNILVEEDLEQVMKDELPSIVFHAAAYKHVPIVEENMFQGIYNNVRGTMITAQLAEKYGVERYVLISTDKAVRPTSIMGASKRIAELYIQNFNLWSKTEFIAVRFGNVLGSSGSVIPKLIEQINKGGPVTVTHPEVTRYFMLTTEAVQLVLQAASIGDGGEIFILNMGNPIRIIEMAEDLIFLSGREPHKDIKIEFTGLRAGEKLYEELLHDETEKKTQYKNITVGCPTHINWEWFNKEIEGLLTCPRSTSQPDLLKAIKHIIPEFARRDLEADLVSKVIPFHALEDVLEVT